MANGALREAVLIPFFGERIGLALSGLVLCFLILLVALGFVRHGRGYSVSQGALIGSLWLLLTLAFEFGFGRYVQGKSWSDLLVAYTFEGGNLWPVVLLVTLLAPSVAALLSAKRQTGS